MRYSSALLKATLKFVNSWCKANGSSKYRQDGLLMELFKEYDRLHPFYASKVSGIYCEKELFPRSFIEFYASDNSLSQACDEVSFIFRQQEFTNAKKKELRDLTIHVGMHLPYEERSSFLRLIDSSISVYHLWTTLLFWSILLDDFEYRLLKAGELIA